MTLLPAQPLARRLAVAGYSLVVTLLLALALVAAILDSERGSAFAVRSLIPRLGAATGVALEIQAVEGTLWRGLTLTGLAVQTGDNTVQAQRLAARWTPLSLMQGRFTLTQLEVQGLRVDWRGGADPQEPPGPLPTLVMPIPLQVERLQVTDAMVTAAGVAQAVQSLSAAVTLGAEGVRIDDLQLSADPWALTGTLALQPTGDYPLEAALNWQYTGAALSAQVPDWTMASGRLTLTGTLAAVTLDHQLDQPLVITSAGRIDTGLGNAGGPFALDLSHAIPALSVPLPDLAAVRGERIDLSTQGDAAALTVALTGLLTAPGVTQVPLSGTLQVTPEGLRMEDLTLTQGDDRLQLAGTVDWIDAVQGSLDLSLRLAAPLDYLANAPAMDLSQLAVAANLAFEMRDGTPTGTLRLDRFDGRLADYDLTGDGALSWTDGGLSFSDLRLATANTSVFVDGRLGSDMDLTWRIDAPDLSQVLQAARGSLQADGQLGGAAAEPAVGARVRVRDLAYGDLPFSVSAAEVDLQGTQGRHTLSGRVEAPEAQLEVALQGGFAAADWRSWRGQVSRLDLSGRPGEWVLTDPVTLTVTGGSATASQACWRLADVRACVTGARDATGDVRGSGSLTGLDLRLLNRDPADHPLRALLGTAVPVLPLGVTLTGPVDLRANLARDAAGVITGTATATVSDATLSLPTQAPGDDPDAPPEAPQVYDLETVTLGAEARDGGWDLRGDLALVRADVGDGSSLRGTARVRANVDAQQRLAGEVQVSMADLGWIAALMPEVSATGGRLEGDARLGGTLNAPQLVRAVLSLQEGRADIAPLGIQVDAVTLDLSTVDPNRIDVTAAARSGNGQLSLAGTVSGLANRAPALEVSVAGTGFTLMETADLQLDISPDLTLSANAQRIHLSGALSLPRLNLRLAGLPETAVDVSRDVVIDAYPEARPDLARSVAGEQGTFMNIPVSAQVSLNLGEAVNFEGFGLNTRLQGALAIELQDTGASRTYGELSAVAGSYRAYSTVLEMEQGKLLFFGAWDNPAVDIRAVRRVEELTVGVQMNGTLKGLRSQLYSSPSLPENDIIAVLITGRPFAEIGAQDSDALLGAVANLGLEGGLGLTNQIRDRLGLDTLAVENTGNIDNSVLTLGKYLSPGLFVRYGVGLFDHQSSVAVDYKVTDTLTLQAESGEFQSIDLTVRIER